MIAEDPKASLSLRAFTAETLVTLLGQSAPLAPNAVVPALLEALDNPNQQLRLIALRYFKSPAVLTPEATVRLFALLTNADFDTRQGAFEALDSIGRTNQNLLPLVQAHLADRRTAVRATAARVLWKITGETSQSVAVLRTMVENQSGHRAAAHYLADMGAAAEPAVGSLNGLAHSDEVGWNDRILAAEAILKIEGPSDAAIRVLIDLLKAATAPADVRSVAEMLGKAGPAARSAIPALDQIAAQYKENRYLKQDLGRIKTVIEGNRPTGAR